jgi:TolB protein
MTLTLPGRLLLAVALLLAAPFLTPATAAAQGLDAGVVSGNEAALPIAVVPMPYQGGGVAPETDVAGVIRADLNRSGQFRSLAEASMIERPTRGSEVRFPTWQLLRQDFIVVGRVLDTGDGAYRVEYELYDIARQQRLLGLALTGRGKGLRDVAHQVADQIYEKILGVRGAFWTRIAYVTASGTGQGTRYALMVADSDGFNPQTVVRSGEPLLSPAWSPDGRRLAYVSFERGNSTIYVQEIASGAREVFASFKGINGAPAFSPDGSRLAMTLSKGGNPEIYVMDLGSKSLTQVTRHFGIDTEAAWTPDGHLVFTSDRAGKPQLYMVSAGGGEPSRLSFAGDSNARASVSFDGKKIAAAQGNGNVYRIAVLDRGFGGSGRWQTLSPGSLDESPSFAPNASMLLYAAKEGRRGVLYAVSADGRVRQRLVLADGDVRDPAWSPYRQR